MGGSVRAWKGMLPAFARPRSLLRLRLVLTRFGDPSVRIRWAVGIGRNAVASRAG